jgi:exopolysaccharide biosynthesis polyprenyl glycosylphosphotransferase
MYQRKNQVQELMICLLDCCGVIISFFGAGLIRFQALGLFQQATNLTPALSGILLLHVGVFYILRTYEGLYRRGPWQEFIKVLKYNIILLMSITCYAFAVKNAMEYTRATLLYFFVLNQFLIFGNHVLVRRVARHKMENRDRTSNVLLITTQSRAEQIIRSMNRPSDWSNKICAVALIDVKHGEGEAQIADVPVVADRDDVLEYAVQNVVDEAFISVPEMTENQEYLKYLILELEQMGIVVNVKIEMIDLGCESAKRIYRMGEYYVTSFTTRLYDYRLMLVKRLMDIVGALVGLCITAVATIFLAPAILLESPGPLFFKQIRIGKNGRRFTFYKFRSMYVDAEERKKELMAQNEMHGSMFKMTNDPRITKVGKFIRKTSLDELPQFWNVLKGDMSLVGTRPPTEDEYLHYEGWQKRRISFRPGITGLWQISGRSNIKDFDEVVKLDLEYIDNWSIGLDMKIILKTVYAVFRGDGAE